MAKSILYIGGGVPDKDASGIRVFSNALALKEAGYDVRILSLEKDCDKASYVEEQGIRIYYQPMPQGNVEWVKYLFELDRYVDFWHEVAKPDVIITYEQPAFSFLRLLRFCHKNGVKLVLDVTEWLTATHLSGIKKFVKQVEVMAEMHYAYKKADAFITIGTYLKNYFGKNGRPVLALPTLQGKSQSLDIPTEANCPRKFIYAGKVGADKDDLYSIIEGFKGLTDFKFNIYGIRQDQYLKMYPSHRSLLDEYKSEINFKGFVPHDIVVQEQIDADYCLIIRQSSRRNNAGFPTKFGESIMYGTPVIATDFSDIREYIETYQLGYVVDSMNKLHDVFANILASPDSELLQLKRNCLNCKFFDYKNHIDDFKSFIESI